jgi:hypothetical protein
MMLNMSWGFMRQVDQHEFNVGSIALGMKVGIAFGDARLGSTTYAALELKAQAATVGTSGKKFRGKARLAGQNPAGVPPADNYHRDVALALVKSNLSHSWALRNPWLALISDYTYQQLSSSAVPEASISTSVHDIVNWIGPEVDNTVITAAYAGPVPLVEAKLSNLDIALAVTHGVSRCALASMAGSWASRSLEFRQDDGMASGLLRLNPEGIELFSWGETKLEGTEVMPFGRFARLSGASRLQTLHSTRQALLVRVGHQPLPFPTDVFDEVIVVDDRPSRGGGLPDFWEATIARVVGRTEANPNIRAVFVFGNQSDAKETVRKLGSIDTWTSEADQMSYKTGMTNNAIVESARRLKGGVFFPQEERTLFSSLTKILAEPWILSSPDVAASAMRPQRFLNRQLQLDRLSLGQEDGCRVNTIAEAYPVVLEIARHTREQDIIRDQAGQQLRELMDFKVHLLQPARDMVPSFYSGDQRSLNDYFDREFLSDAGLFSSRLKANGQLEAVLEHVAAAIRNPDDSFSTRRAILVIPHEVTTGQELAPLGLVSVRIVPRFVALRPVIHFSYTWRTVEALVGFPYSLFGSVRFAQHLTDRIKAVLPPDLQRSLEMGTVSYIAHSLHFFLDDYAQNIARRTVDDATI